MDLAAGGYSESEISMAMQPPHVSQKPPLQHPSDEELVRRVTSGEPEAFEPLVKRYADAIMRFARHMLGDEQAAEDVSQETFLKAYAHIGRLEEPGKFSTWLYSIARHACMDWLRSRHAFTSVEGLEAEGAELEDTSAEAPGEPAEMREAHLVALEELSKLRADYREIILLKHVHGLSYKEIGQMVGLSVSAVGEKLCRVRQMLRRRLARRIKPKIGG